MDEGQLSDSQRRNHVLEVQAKAFKRGIHERLSNGLATAMDCSSLRRGIRETVRRGKGRLRPSCEL